MTLLGLLAVVLGLLTCFLISAACSLYRFGTHRAREGRVPNALVQHSSRRGFDLYYSTLFEDRRSQLETPETLIPPIDWEEVGGWGRYDFFGGFLRSTAIRAGLPFRAFSGYFASPRSLVPAGVPPSRGILRLSQDFRKVLGARDGDVPYSPVWGGLLANTAIYGALWLSLFYAPGYCRRALRLRRGLCPACAYPVGASPVCTECGKHIPTGSKGVTQ